MRVRNKKTGETREIKTPGLRSLEAALSNGIDKCVGPCRCTIEPDGECPSGWPSRMIAAGVI